MTDPTICELAESVRSGEVGAVTVLERYLARIEAGNEELNAFVFLDPDAAHRSAEAIDAMVARGDDPGPLAGVPLGVKDLHNCAGMPTSHGSLWYKGGPPKLVDDIDVARLRAAGCVPVGKTIAPEFGSTSFTSSKAWGIARNPWDLERTPGGSSSGSAAAVAAGLIPLATASDGGGSIRTPAAFCGLVGHKGSFGRVPHPAPMSSQTSVIGVVTTTVRDAARCLDVEAGPDAHDRTSLPPPGVVYEELIETLAVAGLRARWSSHLGFVDELDPEVADLTRTGAESLAAAAGLVLDEEPVHLPDAVKVWLQSGALTTFTMEEVRERWPDRAAELMGYNRGGLESGAKLTSVQLGRIARRRFELEQQVADLFDEVDVLLTPSTAVPAFAAAGPPPGGAMATPYAMVANLAGNPSTSVPCGLTADGLPVGLLITARIHRDDIALRLARIAEQVNPWPRFAPGTPGATATDL